MDPCFNQNIMQTMNGLYYYLCVMRMQGVLLEGSLLKPQMVIPGADYTGGKATPQDIAHHTVTALRRWDQLGFCVLLLPSVVAYPQPVC
jgi:hypothetical protein